MKSKSYFKQKKKIKENIYLFFLILNLRVISFIELIKIIKIMFYFILFFIILFIIYY